LSGPAALARLIRESPTTVADHYHDEIASGVDVMCALTADTMPRVLSEVGMAFRSAALTSCSVDLALDAAEFAPRPIAVAGILGAVAPRSSSGVFPMGSSSLPPALRSSSADRLAEEYAMHAARLAAAGCELILARGVRADLNKTLARLARRAAIVSASATQLPTWAILELEPSGFTPDGESLEDATRSAFESGAQAVVYEVGATQVAEALLARFSTANAGRPFGVVAGDREGSPDAWGEAAKRVLDGGARIFGGGHATTTRHLAVLASMLRGAEPSMWPRAL